MDQGKTAYISTSFLKVVLTMIHDKPGSSCKQYHFRGIPFSGMTEMVELKRSKRTGIRSVLVKEGLCRLRIWHTIEQLDAAGAVGVLGENERPVLVVNYVTIPKEFKIGTAKDTEPEENKEPGFEFIPMDKEIDFVLSVPYTRLGRVAIGIDTIDADDNWSGN